MDKNLVENETIYCNLPSPREIILKKLNVYVAYLYEYIISPLMACTEVKHTPSVSHILPSQ